MSQEEGPKDSIKSRKIAILAADGVTASFAAADSIMYDGLPGSHLRVTTLVLNVIARTKLGCKSSDYDHNNTDNRDDLHGSTWSSPDDNARCPLQLYGGVASAEIWLMKRSNFKEMWGLPMARQPVRVP